MTVKRPGVYFDETTELELVGIGAKIPVVIGATGNTGTQTYPVDGTNIQTFRNFDDANKVLLMVVLEQTPVLIKC